MSSSAQPSLLGRRRFLGGVAAAAVAGSAVTATASAPAGAVPRCGRTFPPSPAPKPIEFVVDNGEGVPEPFRLIHFALPGPDGATTQILELPAFGLDADPSTVGDFHGFTAFAVIAGTATGGDGEQFDCELDVRVMQGRYIGEDGNEHHGTFGFF